MDNQAQAGGNGDRFCSCRPARDIGPDERGVTLIELMVAIGIFGIVMASISTFFSTQTVSNRRLSDTIDADRVRNNITNVVIGDMKRIGLNVAPPQLGGKVLPSGVGPVIIADPNRIVFVGDRNGDGVAASSEIVGYRMICSDAPTTVKATCPCTSTPGGKCSPQGYMERGSGLPTGASFADGNVGNWTNWYSRVFPGAGENASIVSSKLSYLFFDPRGGSELNAATTLSPIGVSTGSTNMDIEVIKVDMKIAWATRAGGTGFNTITKDITTYVRPEGLKPWNTKRNRTMQVE